jgi:HEAT repeat protein
MKAPRKKLIVALTLAFAVAITFLAWRSLYQPEPIYNRKPLSAWARQYGSNHWSGANRAADKEAELAIRQIGTNGIPFLLDLVRARDSAAKKKLRKALPRMWHARLYLNDRSGEIRRVGAHGLAALGSNAPTAVPSLIEIATHHPDDDGRYIAVFAVRTLGSAAEPAIPFLIRCLTNKIDIIRDDAALGLGYIGLRPEIAVPALIQYLESVKSLNGGWQIIDAIDAVAHFGTNARPAVPVLVSLLNHSAADVRQSVTNCLPRIDAEAAAKVHVRRR